MKIAFASCAKIQWFPVQRAWSRIEDEAPDYLLLLGDTVYAPNRELDLAALRARYEDQFAEENFARLVANSAIRVHATWDDHDFGTNNICGAELDGSTYKTAARNLFFEYMLFGQRDPDDVSEVYHSFEIDEVDAKVIMLDVRYYRESPGRNASILGAVQEEWLEDELATSDREFTIVCSGTGLVGLSEPWRRYKTYYKTVTRMLKDKGKVLFLSGDIHKNKFRAHDGFYEAVSSAVGRAGLLNKNQDDIRSNYGIIEFKNDHLEIAFKGNRSKDRFVHRISKTDWSEIETIGSGAGGGNVGIDNGRR